MRDCTAISTSKHHSISNKEGCYLKMLRVGPSEKAKGIFKREPYHLTAAKRRKEIRDE